MIGRGLATIAKNKGFYLSTIRRHAATMLGTVIALTGGPSILAYGAPPGPGTIQRQVSPPSVLPQAPAPVLTLPSPEQQISKSTIRIPVNRIVITGNTLISAEHLLPLVHDVLGRTVTLAELEKAAARITDYYHAQGYPLASAYLPAQKIKDGKLTIAVVEPHYDKILIDDQSRLNAGQARRTLNLASGAPIEQGGLDRGLLLLNQTPGIRVAGTLVPGAKPATSSLETHIRDTPMLQASATVDNFGAKSTGRTRGLIDASIGNPFGFGSQIAVNGITTNGGLLHAGGFSLLSPDLADGLRASAYGSQTRYRLGGTFASLGEQGKATQYGLGLSYPLILAPGRIASVRLDWQRNKFSQISNTVGFDSRSHIDLLRLSVNGALADRTGGMTSGGFSLSHGRLSLDSSDARQADAAGPNAAGSFWVAQWNLRRDQPLPADFRLRADLSGQLASHNLDGSQKFYLGGPYGVMSYAVSSGGGDDGALLQMKLAHDLPLPVDVGRVEAALLGQYGVVWLNRSPYPGSARPNRQKMAGVGVSLGYRWNARVSAEVDYVHRVGAKPSSVTSGDRQRVWASLKLAI